MKVKVLRSETYPEIVGKEYKVYFRDQGFVGDMFIFIHVPKEVNPMCMVSIQGKDVEKV